MPVLRQPPQTLSPAGTWPFIPPDSVPKPAPPSTQGPRARVGEGLLPELPAGLQCQQCHRCHVPCPGEGGRTACSAWLDDRRGRWRRLKPCWGCYLLWPRLPVGSLLNGSGISQASSPGVAGIAEPPGHTLPGSHRHGGACRVVAIPVCQGPGMSRDVQTLPRRPAQPAAALCARHRRAAPMLDLHPRGLPLTRSASRSAQPLPGCHGPSRNVEAMVFHGLGASSAPPPQLGQTQLLPQTLGSLLCQGTLPSIP